MNALRQCYLQYVNRTYRRSGMLWEGRFRASPTQEEIYLLAGQRYIGLNPARVSMVAHLAKCRWSSYQTNAQGEADALATPHLLNEAPGLDAAGKQTAYRKFFRSALETGLMDAVRPTTNRNFALGKERFTAQVSLALGMRVTPEKSGRPPTRLNMVAALGKEVKS